MPGSMKTLADWLAYVEQLHAKPIDMGLERVRAVAQTLGLAFDCPVVTVAGTNGKGSTCAMLESILSNAGYRTAVFTSPHLVRFEERLRLAGEAIDGDRLLTHFEAVERARGATTLTYFEFTTLAILHCMAASKPDVAILEVGLGGRLDAVNIIDADCAVITSIDLDHMELLGPDRERIGFEKAGILRAGRPAIVSDPVPPQSVIDHAQAIGADLWRFGHDFNVSGDKQQWGWSGRGRRYSGLAYPALRGANQLLNAAGVLAALEALRQRARLRAVGDFDRAVHRDGSRLGVEQQREADHADQHQHGGADEPVPRAATQGFHAFGGALGCRRSLLGAITAREGEFEERHEVGGAVTG